MAWFVFIIAVGAVLAVTGGCLSVMYAPVFGGADPGEPRPSR
ncbi:hypothetical protein ACFQXA_33800 [Nocardiopsis composta]